MFPVSDVIPSRTKPFVTVALIVVNAAAFTYEVQLGDRIGPFVREYGLVPALFSWPAVLTSMFLHQGWMHVLGNMLYLWIFGDNVEDRLGHVKYLLFYLLCGAVALLAHTFAHPESMLPTIGASGAIAGVMGAYFVLYPQSRVLTAVFLVFFLDLVEVPAILFLGIWFLMQLFSGVGSLGADAADGGIAFWAHVGGFAAGTLVGLAVRRQVFERWRIS